MEEDVTRSISTLKSQSIPMGLGELRDYNGNNEEFLNYLPQVLFSSQKVAGLVTGLKLMNI